MNFPDEHGRKDWYPLRGVKQTEQAQYGFQQFGVGAAHRYPFIRSVFRRWFYILRQLAQDIPIQRKRHSQMRLLWRSADDIGYAWRGYPGHYIVSFRVLVFFAGDDGTFVSLDDDADARVVETVDPHVVVPPVKAYPLNGGSEFPRLRQKLPQPCFQRFIDLPVVLRVFLHGFYYISIVEIRQDFAQIVSGGRPLRLLS
jgi:hypothetical protein